MDRWEAAPASAEMLPSSKEAADVRRGCSPCRIFWPPVVPSFSPAYFHRLLAATSPLRLLCPPLFLWPQPRRAVPHRKPTRHHRRRVPALRQLGRAHFVRPAALDQTARHVRGHRAGELAVRRRDRVDGPPAVRPGCHGHGVSRLLVLPPPSRPHRRPGRGPHYAGG